MKKRYKVMAREKRGENWQNFTGDRITTIQKMEGHCRWSLKGMSYQFGIFCYEKMYVKERYREVGKWGLKKILEFTSSSDEVVVIKIADRDRVLAMTRGTKRREDETLARQIRRKQRERREQIELDNSCIST
jgi:hypothetical protein